MMRETGGKAARTYEALLDAAVTCAIRRRWNYRGYESQDKTLAALGRRVPGFSRQEKVDALLRGRALYDAAEAAMTSEPQRWTTDKRGHMPPTVVEETRALQAALAKTHPGFSRDTYRGV